MNKSLLKINESYMKRILELQGLFNYNTKDINLVHTGSTKSEVSLLAYNSLIQYYPNEYSKLAKVFIPVVLFTLESNLFSWECLLLCVFPSTWHLFILTPFLKE